MSSLHTFSGDLNGVMPHPLVVGSAVPIKAARKEALPMRGGFMQSLLNRFDTAQSGWKPESKSHLY